MNTWGVLHSARRWVVLFSCLLLILAGLSSLSLAGTLTLEFDQPAGTVRDFEGTATGFTTRLPGSRMPSSDLALVLNTTASQLHISTTTGDLNGGIVNNLSMPGLQLSSLGYTGTQDFSVTAEFAPLPNLESIDQVGIYVGENVFNLTRAGVIQFDQPEYLAVHTTNASDNNGLFFGAGIDISDGMEVTIQRVAGDWQYFIDGVEWQPNSFNNGFGIPVDPNGLNGSPNLDASSDLYVGVFALTVFNSNTKVLDLDRFVVTVVPEPGSLSLAALCFASFVVRRSKRGTVC